MACDLCKLKKKTKWHYEGPQFAVLDCETCGTPMWVPYTHALYADPVLQVKARAQCQKLFGKGIMFRPPRRIKDHYHEHVVKV